MTTTSAPETTTNETNPPITNRYDLVYYFEIIDGNPNGDPDAGNLPRIDPETGQGLVTDVCLKRKIRNYVGLKHGEHPPYGVFIKERSVLNDTIERSYLESDHVRKCLREWDEWKANKKKHQRPKIHYEDLAASWLCDNFFDIRCFGAVLSTGSEKILDGFKSKIRMTAGQVRGPVQFSMARSVNTIVTLEHSITRCAVTKAEDLEKERAMGRKFTVPYGLYRAHIYVSPHLADPERHGTGFGENDLQLLKEALNHMYEIDHSAARGQMNPVCCVAFRHDKPLGCARSDQLFARVQCGLRNEVIDSGQPPRGFEDFALTIDGSDLPEGVTMETWIAPPVPAALHA